MTPTQAIATVTDEDVEWEPDYDDRECTHEDYEITWEGRAECQGCNHHWYPTAEEIDEYYAAMAQYYEPESWWFRYWQYVMRPINRIRQMMPRKQRTVSDDDIPF